MSDHDYGADRIGDSVYLVKDGGEVIGELTLDEAVTLGIMLLDLASGIEAAHE